MVNVQIGTERYCMWNIPNCLFWKFGSVRVSPHALDLLLLLDHLTEYKGEDFVATLQQQQQQQQ